MASKLSMKCTIDTDNDIKTNEIDPFTIAEMIIKEVKLHSTFKESKQQRLSKLRIVLDEIVFDFPALQSSFQSLYIQYVMAHDAKITGVNVKDAIPFTILSAAPSSGKTSFLKLITNIFTSDVKINEEIWLQLKRLDKFNRYFDNFKSLFSQIRPIMISFDPLTEFKCNESLNPSFLLGTRILYSAFNISVSFKTFETSLMKFKNSATFATFAVKVLRMITVSNTIPIYFICIDDINKTGSLKADILLGKLIDCTQKRFDKLTDYYIISMISTSNAMDLVKRNERKIDWIKMHTMDNYGYDDYGFNEAKFAGQVGNIGD